MHACVLRLVFKSNGQLRKIDQKSKKFVLDILEALNHVLHKQVFAKRMKPSQRQKWRRNQMERLGKG